ncbi:hypothetical protein LINGRAHAP2_LOCUS34679 [Linum grandiflorum]
MLILRLSRYDKGKESCFGFLNLSKQIKTELKQRFESKEKRFPT